LAYGRATGALAIPGAFYPVFGAIFMFRIIIYVYDLAHSRERARLLPFLSYFFVLPNYYFTFFPVIDFQTMRRSYYQRDIHEIAQQGIRWMTRGASWRFTALSFISPTHTCPTSSLVFTPWSPPWS
jgi:hypothetical protein